MRKSPLLIAFFTVVLVLLTGGAVAFAALGKTVTVSVDGRERSVRTFAGHVGEVLNRAGVHVGEHDVVVPSQTASVADGERIVVRHGRPLALTVNGERRTVWVTATKVSAALDELGLQMRGQWVSASRSLTIPRKGLDLAVRNPQHVSVLVDGNRLQPTTTAASVADLLNDVHVTLAGKDETSVPLATYPTGGMVVKVTRIRDRRVLKTEEIPFGTETRTDDSMYSDQKNVVREGQPGVKVLDYIYTFRDGKAWKRRLVNSVVKKQPLSTIVVVGTKNRPAPVSHAASADGLNWSRLAQCESGGNPRAVSYGGTYRGLYQFDMGTWHGVGGVGDPIDASPSEQTYRAQLLYRERGDSPWPVCGHYLYS